MKDLDVYVLLAYNDSGNNLSAFFGPVSTKWNSFTDSLYSVPEIQRSKRVTLGI